MLGEDGVLLGNARLIFQPHRGGTTSFPPILRIISRLESAPDFYLRMIIAGIFIALHLFCWSLVSEKPGPDEDFCHKYMKMVKIEHVTCSLVPGCLIGQDFHRLPSHFQHPLTAILHGRRKLSYIIRIDRIYWVWSRQKMFIRRRKNWGGDWMDLHIQADQLDLLLRG